MYSLPNAQKNLFIVGIPILIIGLMVIIAKSSIFENDPMSLSLGITFDLVLTVPIIYFFLIRKTNIPKITVVPLMIIGVVICSTVLPPQNQYYLTFFKAYLLPIVELSIVTYVIYNVVQTIKLYKTNKKQSIDFFTALKITCYKKLPKSLVVPFVTEIAVFYYGFIFWKKRKLKENEFSYHRESGTLTLLIAIIFIVALETFVLHIMLAKWSNIVAWILTFLSVYSGIQLFGFLKSMYARPISIEKDKLILRYGIMSQTTIDLATIESLELTSSDIQLNKETRKLSFLGELESHNVIIRLKEENILTGLYGIKRKYRNLVFYVDNKTEFKDKIDSAMRLLS